MSTAVLDAPAKCWRHDYEHYEYVCTCPPHPIHPLEQAVLDYLDEHPGSRLSDAVYSLPSMDEDRAVALVARLLWHRRLPLLMARIEADRAWFGLPEAVTAARRLLFDEDEPVTCGQGAHTPECATGQDECPEGQDERVMDDRFERLADSLGMRY